MAWTVPTPADLKLDMPAFAGVDDAVVQRAIDKYPTYVDDTWPTQAEFTEGVELYAAHVMYRAGYGPGAAAGSDDAPANLKMRKAGDRTEEFFSPTELQGAGATSGGLVTSRYGRDLTVLIRRLFAGPRVY